MTTTVWPEVGLAVPPPVGKVVVLEAAGGLSGTLLTTGATGVTALLASVLELVPLALVAVTVKAYAVPLVSPVTVQVVAGAVAVQVKLPTDEVTV